MTRSISSRHNNESVFRSFIALSGSMVEFTKSTKSDVYLLLSF